MRQCPAVAWEGWITKTHRRNELNSGRRSFFDGPAARLVMGWVCRLLPSFRSARIAFCHGP